MAGDDFKPFVRKLDDFARDLRGQGMVDLLTDVGMEAKKDVERAVRNDIGDLSMSGWTHPTKDGPRTRPPQLTGRFEATPEKLTVDPAAAGSWRKGLGPMRVLESGRKAYAAGDRRVTGSYTSKKTGAVTQRTRKVKGRVGATRGKGTWSDAEKRIAATLHNKAQQAFNKLVTRSFGG